MIFEGSRYARVGVTRTADGKDYVPPRDRAAVRPEDVTFVAADPGDTWISLATRHLGNPELWWAIAEINGVVNPLEPLEPGAVIAVPTVRALHEVIL